MKELGFKTIKLKSRPITLKDVANQIAAMGIAKDLATRDSMLKEINQQTGMDLQLAAMPQPDQTQTVFGEDGKPKSKESTVPEGTLTASQTPHEELPASMTPQGMPHDHKVIQMQPKTPGGLPSRPGKKAQELIELAHDFAAFHGLGLTKKRDFPVEQGLLLKQEVASLNTEDREAFDTLLAQYTYGADSPDLVKIIHR